MLISWQGEPYFNPRSRVGNDPAPFTIAATPDISIHVPAWGTTSLTFPQGRQYSYFNPRSRVGNDQGRNMRLLLMFDFNPRSRVGNDGRARPLSDGWCISIHVPAWGTTAIPCRSCPVSVFQSTFPRGERRWLNMFCPYSTISIHVPAWGTTVMASIFIPISDYFNPRSRVGNDCKFQQFFTYIFV